MGVTTRPDARSVFAVLDTMDIDSLITFFAPNARVVFGNGEPMVGVDEFRAGTTAFLETIAGLRHSIVTEWNFGDDTIVELNVTYHRKDGQQVAIPCATIFHTDATGKIDNYRVFFDVAPIHA
jgi:ketosteroid isomerase-like protein